MALESNLQLISYMATAEMYDKSENIYECFLPIVESILMIYIDKAKVSLVKLQSELDSTYHLKVPKSTLKRTLQILRQQKKVKIINLKKIIPYKDELNASYWNKREERENAIDDFFFEFNSFLAENGIDIPIAQVKEDCCHWLYTHTLELASFISKGNFSSKMISSEEKDWEIGDQLAAFLLDIQSKKSEYFKTFLLLYNGAVQSSLFNFEIKEIDNLNKTAIPFSNIILDTNFILRMLDLQTEFDGAAAKETLLTLEEENTHFFILEQTLDEIIRSIKNFLSESGPNTIYTNRIFKNSHIRMTGFFDAVRRGTPRKTLFEMTGKEALKNNISKLINVTYIDDYDHTKISAEQIKNLITSKNRDTYGEIQACHDLGLIDYCRQQRGGDPSKITDIDWWVLTNDERLTHWNQENSGQYQECLTEIQLSNIIMLQRKKTDNSGLMQTMVSLSAKTALSAEGIKQFAQKIYTYHENNKDSNLALKKLSLVFANNLLTTADIQMINADEDAFDQILEDKISEVQKEQSLQEEKLKRTEEDGENKAKAIVDLKSQLNNYETQIIRERYEYAIEKFERDISDKSKEKETVYKQLAIYEKLLEFERLHDISTGRYTLMLALLPIVIMLPLYARYGCPILKPFLLTIDRMTGFMQDMLVWMIPVVLTLVYYLAVVMCFGGPLSPSDLFQVLKRKVSNMRLKKYMIKNDISLSYLKPDKNQTILNLKKNIENINRSIKSLEDKRDETKEKLNNLDNI